MNSSLIQKLLFLHRKSSKPQEAKNEKIEISLENGKFDNFVDNGLEAGHFVQKNDITCIR